MAEGKRNASCLNGSRNQQAENHRLLQIKRNKLISLFKYNMKILEPGREHHSKRGKIAFPLLAARWNFIWPVSSVPSSAAKRSIALSEIPAH